MALPDLVLTSTRVVTPQGEGPGAVVPITPYAGLVLEGEVLRTFMRGSCVYDNSRFPEKSGRWLQREGV
jgi:dihydroorotase-like cyclic amidohydrolase